MSKEPKVLKTEQEIYNKIVELYNEKQMFIIHILRSNFPLKTKRVISFINENLRNRRCCISDAQLIDLSRIAKDMSKRDEIPYDVIIHSLSDIRTPIHVINEEAGDKTLALIGEKSDKMISLDGYNQLMKFAATEFNKNNPLIKKVLYQEFSRTMKKDALKRFDFSLSFNKLPTNVKNNFDIYVRERFIQSTNNINNEYIWNMMSGRNQS